MTAAAKELAKKALTLPENERAKLAGLLFDSLHPSEEKLSTREWNRVWKAELERRIEDVRSGKVKTIPYARLKAIIGQN